MKKSMKRAAALLLALILCFAGSSMAFAQDIEIDDWMFDLHDVPYDAWYYDGAYYVYFTGIMTGGTGQYEKYFMPEEDLQRQDLAVIFGRLYKNTLNSALDLSSTDGSYYANALAWVKQYHIMNGYNAENFGIGDAITRQDFAVALCNYLQAVVGYTEAAVVIDPNVLDSYADRQNVSAYAEKSMCWMVEAGVIKGYESNGVNVLDPQAKVTRSMAAVMLQRFAETYASDFEQYGDRTLLP